jgi:hypothetical protein
MQLPVVTALHNERPILQRINRTSDRDGPRDRTYCAEDASPNRIGLNWKNQEDKMIGCQDELATCALFEVFPHRASSAVANPHPQCGGPLDRGMENSLLKPAIHLGSGIHKRLPSTATQHLSK